MAPLQKVIGLRGVVVTLGGFPALTGCDFDAFSGESILLFGPNGSGKSTLLQTIAGLYPLRRGSGRVFGLDLQSEQARRSIRGVVNYVGHDSHLYDDLTVAENLEFARAVGRVPQSRLSDAMEIFALPKSLAQTSIKRLSAGQRRKVSLVSALAKESELLLLDEPHGALDREAKLALDAFVVAERERGKTILVASHEIDPDHHLATRSVQLRGGRIVSDTGGQS